MKFFKTTLALFGAVALLAAPAAAQYGKEEEEAKEASKEKVGVWANIKDFFTAEALPIFFADDPTGAILNLTDATYKDLLFQGEYIVTFCSPASPPCADYYPTYLDVATTMKGETETTFAAVWVEENPRLAARFFVPARLPYVVYAKDGVFRQIPYERNNTKFLIDFIEEERYQYYGVMDGPMSPYSKLADWFEKYVDVAEWIGQYTAWMPRWMVYIIAGSMSGIVFTIFSGGSAYSSDPSKYSHLNPDGTLKKADSTAAGSNATEGSSSATTKKPSAKKRTTKKA